jgi:hypothetical protein
MTALSGASTPIMQVYFLLVMEGRPKCDRTVICANGRSRFETSENELNRFIAIQLVCVRKIRVTLVKPGRGRKHLVQRL